MPVARPSSRSRPASGGGKKKSELDTMEENDVLRMRILRERGGSTIHKAGVDDGDFEEVLRKEGVGQDLDLSSGGTFVEKPSFDLVIGIAIMVNAIVLGLEIDLSEQTDPMVWIACENVFCSIWIAEMLLKWWFLRLSYFCDAWNWLDLSLVMLSIYDAWVAPLAWSRETTMDLGFLRVVRVMRLLRLVKLIRVIKMSRNLWLLVQGFIESFSTLSWVSFLILFVIYAYSAFFRIVVDCGKDFAGWSDCSMMFGSVPKSMYTLFQVLTLESWSMIISRPLMEVQPVLVIPIISFILLTTFGTLNIIVGVVVENTLSAAKQNLDLQNKRAEKQVIKELELLRTVFEEADTDGSGTMDKEEFIEICGTASVRRALQRMGVPLDQSETLFDIIDSSKKNEVTFAGFIEGVKKVRGAPTSLDMKTMMVAVRNIYKQQVKLEKDSQQLQAVLLDLIEEAQRNGNVIHLPPKEDMEGLLLEKKKLMSQMSFCSLKSPVSQQSTASEKPSLFGRVHAGRSSPKAPKPKDHQEAPAQEEAYQEGPFREADCAATAEEAEPIDVEPSYPERQALSKSDGELSITPVTLRDLPNAVPEESLDAGTAVPDEVLSPGARDYATVQRPPSASSTRSETQTLHAVIRPSCSQERLAVMLHAKHLQTNGQPDRRHSPVRVKLTDKQLLAETWT